MLVKKDKYAYWTMKQKEGFTCKDCNKFVLLENRLRADQCTGNSEVCIFFSREGEVEYDDSPIGNEGYSKDIISMLEKRSKEKRLQKGKGNIPEVILDVVVAPPVCEEAKKEEVLDILDLFLEESKEEILDIPDLFEEEKLKLDIEVKPSKKVFEEIEIDFD